MTELEVPEAARDALRDTDKYAVDVDPQVRAIAAPVVAAELRRLSEHAYQLEQLMMNRASELDGGP